MEKSLNNHSGYRVLIVDDQEEHLLQFMRLLEEALVANPKLFGNVKPTFATASDATKIVDEILHQSEFPHDIIIADIFMPLNPRLDETPHPRGGAVRIYEAIKEKGLQKSVFLVMMSNRNSEAQIELNEIRKEQDVLEIPWAIASYPKSRATPAPSSFNSSYLLSDNDWKYAIGTAIGRCRDLEWKTRFVKATLHEIVGNSGLLTEAKLHAERYANVRIIVLLGETGSGKELIADSIHRNSERSHGNYVTHNCPSFREESIEADLFGYEKGAFTGAYRRTFGMLERCAKGTLFLDEFGQSNVLNTAIEELLRRVLAKPHQFNRMAGQEVLQFDGTIIFGGSELDAYLKSDYVSPDFKSRLSGAPRIRIPPLRDRPEDILALAEYFLSKFCKELGLPEKVLSKEVKKWLVHYRWPGNVRQLENEMGKLATVLSLNITLDDIPDLLLESEDISNVPSGPQSAPPTPEDVLYALRKASPNATHAARMLYSSVNDVSTPDGTLSKRLTSLIEAYKSDPGFDAQLKTIPLKGPGRPRSKK